VRVEACPRCASLRIGMPTLGEGLVAGGGEGLLSVCRDCGYRGMPVGFDGAEEYERFRAELPGAVVVQEPVALPAPPRERWAPALVLLAGAAFLLFGALTMGASALTRTGLVLYGPAFALLGLALMLAAWRQLR
jgi:hypothetical protein